MYVFLKNTVFIGQQLNGEIEAYQVHTHSQTALGFILAYLGHSFGVQVPDINAAVDARAREVVAVCGEGDCPDLCAVV